jgi:hypothetical protein
VLHGPNTFQMIDNYGPVILIFLYFVHCATLYFLSDCSQKMFDIRGYILSHKKYFILDLFDI